MAKIMIIIFILECIASAIILSIVLYHFKQFKLSLGSAEKNFPRKFLIGNLTILFMIFIFLLLFINNA